jgi:membrane fusion protein (multidrug efflux system)
MKKKIIVLLTVVAVAGIGALGFAKRRMRARDLARLEAVDTETFLVKTEKAAERDLEEQLVLSGSVKALDEAVLYPRVAGKLLKNLLKEGDAVARDQAVALVEHDEVGVKYEPAPVPSTLGGVVGRIYQDVGANLTPQTPIALVVNQSSVRIRVDLPERYLGRIASGGTAHVLVDAWPDRTFTGRVYKVSPVVDPDTRSAPVEVLADNTDGGLKSGMFAQVRLVVGRRPRALSVSAGAVQTDDKGASVVFLTQDRRAVARPVRLGLRTADYVEILSGVRPGEPVIVSGLYGLKDGSKVEASE